MKRVKNGSRNGQTPIQTPLMGYRLKQHLAEQADRFLNSGNGNLKGYTKKVLLSAHVLERLAQVTQDLEEIVEMTQGKEPEEFRFNGHSLVQKAERAGRLAFLDAYRSITLLSLVQGRFGFSVYTIGKKLGLAFPRVTIEGLKTILEDFGIRGIRHLDVSEKQVHVELDHSVTSRGVRRARRPVCYLEAGLMAGLLENVLRKKIEVREIKCRANGDPACLFELLKFRKPGQEKDPFMVALLNGGYAEENLRLLTTLASHALTAIDNTLLLEKTRHQAVIDGLTEIYNHRYFQEMIRVELRRSHRHKIPVALMMIDIDHFKLFNDRYGHPKGDELLKRIASFLKSAVRDIDIVARYGGDEFAIILPQTDSHGAIRVAERMRKSGFLRKCRDQHPDIKLGFAFGIHSTTGEKPIEPQKFIDRADQALLKAKRKREGRIGLVLGPGKTTKLL